MIKKNKEGKEREKKIKKRQQLKYIQTSKSARIDLPVSNGPLPFRVGGNSGTRSAVTSQFQAGSIEMLQKHGQMQSSSMILFHDPTRGYGQCFLLVSLWFYWVIQVVGSCSWMPPSRLPVLITSKPLVDIFPIPELSWPISKWKEIRSSSIVQADMQFPSLQLLQAEWKSLNSAHTLTDTATLPQYRHAISIQDGLMDGAN